MRQPSRKPTVYLGDMAFVVYKKLLAHKPYGWLSKFVSEQLTEHYGKDFESVVLTELINKKSKERNKLEVEMDRIVKRLKKLRR